MCKKYGHRDQDCLKTSLNFKAFSMLTEQLVQNFNLFVNNANLNTVMDSFLNNMSILTENDKFMEQYRHLYFLSHSKRVDLVQIWKKHVKKSMKNTRKFSKRGENKGKGRGGFRGRGRGKGRGGYKGGY